MRHIFAYPTKHAEMNRSPVKFHIVWYNLMQFVCILSEESICYSFVEVSKVEHCKEGHKSVTKYWVGVVVEHRHHQLINLIMHIS